jgi:hypothetical protein
MRNKPFTSRIRQFGTSKNNLDRHIKIKVLRYGLDIQQVAFDRAATIKINYCRYKRYFDPGVTSVNDRSR